MFDKMKFKINSLIMLTFSVGFIIIGIASYSVIKAVIYDNFIDFSEKNIAQKISNIYIYSKFIEETSRQVSTNPSVINFLADNATPVNVVNSLDSVKQSHFGILGVALFDVSGNSYLSNYTSSYPSLAELSHNKTLDKLLSPVCKSFWSVRTNDIAGYYNYTSYNRDYGVITYASKLYDGKGALCGYLFVDIDPQYIYSFFNNNSDAFPSNTISFIADKTAGILPSKLNHSLNYDVIKELASVMGKSDGYRISQGNDLILFACDYLDNGKIIAAVPLEGLFKKLNSMLIIMVIVIVLLILTIVFISAFLTNSIFAPLSELYARMKSNSL